MTRARLRPAYGSDELARIYPVPHDHTQWLDHQMRVAFTFMATHAVDKDIASAADLSCGDGAILKALDVKDRHFGDFAPGYQYTGPIEQTIEQIPNVDLFVCTETIEHLDDPDLVLKKVRTKTERLLLSTPIDAWQDPNPEHYWAWSREGVEELLTVAGFKVVIHVALDVRPAGGDYQFGIWACV